MTPNTGALNAHLNLWMAAGGLRGTLMDGGGTGLTLTGVTDPLVVGTSSVRGLGAKGKLSAADAMVTRLRLGPVLAWTWGGFNPCIPGSRAIDRSAGSGSALPRDGRLPGSRLLRLPLLAATAGLRPPHHPGRVGGQQRRQRQRRPEAPAAGDPDQPPRLQRPASPSRRSWGWASTTAAGITVLAGA